MTDLPYLTIIWPFKKEKKYFWAQRSWEMTINYCEIHQNFYSLGYLHVYYETFIVISSYSQHPIIQLVP